MRRQSWLLLISAVAMLARGPLIFALSVHCSIGADAKIRSAELHVRIAEKQGISEPEQHRKARSWRAADSSRGERRIQR
jgi:hypothetical protein